MDTQPIANCCPKCQTALPPDAPQGLCPKCLFAAVATPTEADQPAGNRPAPPALTEIAAAFPQLEILEFIGQGGMGFVFKARQPKLDRLVALKILPQSLAADPTFAERFNREAKLLARLNHPGIVTVHDFGVATGWADLPVRPDVEAAQQHRPTTPLYYLLMEFVDGVNLRQAMQAGRFTPAQALAIVPKICEALQFAHNEGILHRDINPENILLDAKGRVKIADFGIAKLVEGRAGSPLPAAESPNTSGAQGTARPTTELTEAGKTLGSPNYMAPEQLEHPGEVDHRADIYSLGVVFYEMLTGELPLGRFAPPSQKSAADPRVDEVVLRALEKERERRQHSAGEVKTQVETIAATPHSADQKNANASISKSRFGRIVLVGVSNEKRAINWTGVIQIWVVICGVMLAGAYIAFGRWVPFHDLIASIVGVATLVTAAWVKVELKKPHDQLPPCGSRREEAQTEKAESGNRKSEIEPRFSPKAIVVAVLLVFIGSVLAFALVRNHIAKPTSMPLSETEFLQKFEANQIERATVSYNPQLPDVAKISGTYYRTDKDGNIIKTEKEVPFIVENALITPNLERKLVRSDKIVFNTPNPMLKAAAYNLLFFAGIGMVILLLLGIIIYVVTLVMKRPVGAPVPPVQKPDRFWRWFAVAVFAMIAIPFLISIFGLLAAIAIPNFVKARAQAQENARRAAAQMSTNQLAAQNLSFGPVMPASALQFRLVVPEGSTEPADELPSISGPDRFHVLRKTLLDGSAVAQAGVDFSPDGTRRIEIQFTAAGKQHFAEITGANINRQLAVVLGGKVLSAPFIRATISGGQCQIDGNMSREEVYALLDCLNRTTTASAQTLKFTAPRERILPFQPSPGFLVGWLDLDSGTVLTNSILDWQTRAGHEWIRSNSLDLATTDSSKEIQVLLGFDAIILAAPTNGWDTLTPIDVAYHWNLLQDQPMQMKMFGAKSGQSDTYFFRTREGGVGLLQITGFTEDPRGVRLRYKLVQNSTSTNSQ